MKRILSLLLAICMLMSLSTSVVAVDSLEETEIEMLNGKPRLSAMSEEECRALAVSIGLSVDENSDVKATFALLEEDPNYGIMTNVAEPAMQFRAMREFVRSYYGWSATECAEKSPTTRAYSLQSSDLTSAINLLKNSSYSNWNVLMENYNCYAYALGRTEAFYNPGDIGNQMVSASDRVDYGIGICTIEELADMVKFDLQEGLNYACVKIQETRPTSTTGWENVIAARKETQMKSYNRYGDYYYNDFHFARLNGDTWYHKPGSSAVLAFNTAPNNNTVWIQEAISGEYVNGEWEYEYYYNKDVVYDSNIKYISYKPSHGSTGSTWTGNHYHLENRHYYEYGDACGDCGDILPNGSTEWRSFPCTGPNCVMPWSVGTGDVVS